MVSSSGVAEPARPNVVIILADDLGLGDISGLNPDAKLSTPHLDGLIERGMAFSDAHSASSVCTPTRYGLLTGRYAWRSPLKEKVLDAYARPLIPPGRDTLASLLQRAGYRTALVGKWHLGLGWQTLGGDDPDHPRRELTGDEVDFARPFTGGPRELGFDSWYGVAASLDFPPYVMIRGDRVERLPTESRDAQGGRRSDEPQVMMRRGRQAPGFEPEAVMRRLTRESVGFIEAQSDGRPFFLLLSLTAPHTPVLPHADFVGGSDAGIYGDFVQEIDWSVGQVLGALERRGLTRDTLVVFTADNGTSRAAFPPELERRYGHATSLGFKGRKGSLDEGGHRVPLLLQWPAVVPAGASSGATVNLNDFYATLAELTDQPIADDAGEDSFSLLPLLRGEAGAYGRAESIHHDFAGRFAIRRGRWKLLVGKKAGDYRLYDLQADPSETTDLADREPDTVRQLLARMTEIVERGRSTPGPARANDGPAWWPQLVWMPRP